MSKLAVRTLRAVLVLAFVGALFVQVVMTPLFWADLLEAPATVRVPFVIIGVLGMLTIQVSAVCVWRLLTMVDRGTVFTTASFRYVDVIIGSIAAAALLVFALGVVLAPGEAVAPGIVALIGGASLVIAGVALIVLVLRALLAQAVARDAEARSLQAEIDEVI